VIQTVTMSNAQIVVVTGASSGIGRAAAVLFGASGASVLAVGRDGDALAGTVAEIERRGGKGSPLVADVTAAAAPSRIVGACLERYGGLTTLVNAAGIIATGRLDATTDDQWDTIMDINVRAPFRLMREASAALVAAKGSVVNVSSVNGLRSFPGVLAYCVSKSAIDQLTRCAALEFAAMGVRINSVNPGVTRTNLHRRGGMEEEAYGKFLERARETHPLGRPGEPDDVAEMIVFLASDRASFITGETIAIDGGRHLTCAR
jgi:NAD(P)-dependent dehydrogenase (short-subunit alcohol dehydrogenase family)